MKTKTEIWPSLRVPVAFAQQVRKLQRDYRAAHGVNITRTDALRLIAVKLEVQTSTAKVVEA